MNKADEAVKNWLEWRREGLGGSDAAVIMGVSPWRTLYDLYEEKALGVDKSFETAATRRGKELEEIARCEFERQMNTSVVPTCLVHPEKSWLRGSLDGLCFDGKILVEIKCPGKEDHSLASAGKVPEKYYPQCQHYLALTGLPKMYYFSYFEQKGVIVEVERDEEYIGTLLIKEAEFWQAVQEKIPPEKVIKYLPMQEEEEWEKLEKEWLVLKARHDADEKALKRIRETCALLSEGKSAEGNSMRLIVSECKGSVDYESAIEDYIAYLELEYPDIEFLPLNFEKYRKEGYSKYSLKAI